MNFKSETFKLYFNLGSKLYFMNKDGGLSFFDVATSKVTEVLDNTTFVSINYFILLDKIKEEKGQWSNAGSVK